MRKIKDLINKNQKLRSIVIPIYKRFFFNSNVYWEKRYNSGGNSGTGSYGRLAEFKAEIINNFIKENKVETICEFGCGDGANLKLYNFEKYFGYDVSKTVIEQNKIKFKNTKFKFDLISNLNTENKFDLTLSLDVIYHLTDNKIYQDYLKKLFYSSSNYVIIYSSNFDDLDYINAHIRHRKFINDIPSSFKLVEHIPNAYPEQISSSNSGDTSYADFFIFKKI